MAKKRTIRTIPQQRTPMPRADRRSERVKNFAEVACGFTAENALREVARCLLCPEQPCVDGCPVGVDIPGFIRKIGDKDFRGAYDALTGDQPAAGDLRPGLPAGEPVRRRLHGRRIAGAGRDRTPRALCRRHSPSRKAGSTSPISSRTASRSASSALGPAGVACAADMAKAGCEVVVYEAFHRPGGVLRYGIPDFRLPNAVIDAEIDNLRKLGVKFECNTLVGRLFTIEQMIDEMGFDAVFIGTGAGYPTMPGIPGDSLNGVLSANELLTRCNLMRAKEFPNFDTPMPIETARRGDRRRQHRDGRDAGLPAGWGREEVHCIYRRSRTECPARAEEVHHAEEEGVEFHWLTNPVAILDDGAGGVRAMRCIRMELGEPDESGRRRPVPVAGQRASRSRSTSSCSPSAPTPTRSSARPRSFKLNKRGYIETDDNLATSMAGVYAGGDIVTGAATVIEAMGAGRRAARSIKDYLRTRDRDDGALRQAAPGAARFFGIDLRERNFARIRVA